MILTTLRSSLTFSIISAASLGADSLGAASLGAASLGAASLGAAMMALMFLGSSGSNKALYLGCCAGAFFYAGFVS